MNSLRLTQKFIKSCIIVALLIASSSAANAACMRDSHGEVFCGAGACQVDRDGAVLCSRFRDGGAVKTKYGEVVCGIGHCAKTMSGKIYCSASEGGAVTKDLYGNVRCYGNCELAKKENCENTVAGTGLNVYREGLVQRGANLEQCPAALCVTKSR